MIEQKSELPWASTGLQPKDFRNVKGKSYLLEPSKKRRASPVNFREESVSPVNLRGKSTKEHSSPYSYEMQKNKNLSHSNICEVKMQHEKLRRETQASNIL